MYKILNTEAPEQRHEAPTLPMQPWLADFGFLKPSLQRKVFLNNFIVEEVLWQACCEKFTWHLAVNIQNPSGVVQLFVVDSFLCIPIVPKTANKNLAKERFTSGSLVYLFKHSLAKARIFGFTLILLRSWQIHLMSK